MGCGTFNPNINLINDGESVDAAVANRPLQQLLLNDLYLNCVLQAINQGGGSGTGSLILRGVQLKSSVQVGTPVFYNTGTALYEPAFDDGSNKRYVVGLCIDKNPMNVGDLLVAGTAPLNLAIPIGGTPVPGRYFLSTTTVGGLFTTIAGVQVCFLDNNGNVTFDPRIQDPLNIITLIAPANTLSTPVTLIDIANPNGLMGVGTVKNTGSTNAFKITETVTDAFGTTDFESIVIEPRQFHRLKTWRGFNTAQPPHVAYTVTIQDATGGSHTSYVGTFMNNRF